MKLFTLILASTRLGVVFSAPKLSQAHSHRLLQVSIPVQTKEFRLMHAPLGDFTEDLLCRFFST